MKVFRTYALLSVLGLALVTPSVEAGLVDQAKEFFGVADQSVAGRAAALKDAVVASAYQVADKAAVLGGAVRNAAVEAGAKMHASSQGLVNNATAWVSDNPRQALAIGAGVAVVAMAAIYKLCKSKKDRR